MHAAYIQPHSQPDYWEHSRQGSWEHSQLAWSEHYAIYNAASLLLQPIWGIQKYN